ncbi:MAG TPA: hypothetical protein VNF72_19520 [Myxococcota bacterium]|jgi:hypothetical protein|nr:hypothetical protein [Myxococcota bacterium]
MRVVPLAICLVVFSTAASAQSFGEPLQCRTFDRQIAHFEMMRKRAVAIDSDLWKDRFDNHLAQLKKFRLSQGCPDKSGAAEFARLMKALMQLAAQGAITFFTMGMM